MNKNAGWTVGACLSRLLVCQPPRSSAALSQSIWSNGIQRRGITSGWQRPGSSSIYLPVPRLSLGLRLPSPLRPSLARQNITFAVWSAWSRNASSKSSRTSDRNRSNDRRNKSSVTNGVSKNKKNGGPQAPQASLSPQPEAPPKPSKAASKSKPKPVLPQVSSKPLLDRLPHSLPHLYRPNKAEMLAAASGFWSRIKIHFKWVTIRSSRPFNADEIYALFSWVLAAHVLWVVLGTTTFFMLFIFLINTAFSQETLGKWIGNYLTKSSGIKVVFETAVVPKWKDGVISFRNVFVSRRPGQGHGKVIKGTQTEMAEAAAVLAQQEKDVPGGTVEVAEPEEDTNYTQFDISIDTVNVTLSFFEVVQWQRPAQRC